MQRCLLHLIPFLKVEECVKVEQLCKTLAKSFQEKDVDQYIAKNYSLKTIPRALELRNLGIVTSYQLWKLKYAFFHKIFISETYSFYQELKVKTITYNQLMKLDVQRAFDIFRANCNPALIALKQKFISLEEIHQLPTYIFHRIFSEERNIFVLGPYLKEHIRAIQKNYIAWDNVYAVKSQICR